MPLSPDERALLLQVALGGRLYRDKDPRTGEDIWTLSPFPGTKQPVKSEMARALARASFIEPTGLPHWRATTAGRAELTKELKHPPTYHPRH